MNGKTITGLEAFCSLKKKERLAILCNQASVDSGLNHTADLLLSKGFNISAFFGAQHGIRGEKQDNMIESCHFIDRRTGLKVFSLYSETRELTEEMASFFDTLIFDMQDVGSRYYTFLTTLINCLRGCEKYGKKLIVLDRPNPISGLQPEGNLIKEGFFSFVGAISVSVRHGLTLGELALMARKKFRIDVNLEVIQLKNWKRSFYFNQTGLPWIMPSPNMPLLDTALVYPGGCLYEATNLSEGRGTTKPFEYVGAPFIDPYELADYMKKQEIKGAFLRPIYFQPTFHKWAGEVCGGIHFYLTDRNIFQPYRTALKLLFAVKNLYPDKFCWKLPPYEYENSLLPIDILTGNSIIREIIDRGENYYQIEAFIKDEEDDFYSEREEFFLYT